MSSNLEKRESMFYEDQNLLLVCWEDHRLVTFFTIIEKEEVQLVNNAPIQSKFQIPLAVNLYIRGVDRFDQFASTIILITIANAGMLKI